LVELQLFYHNYSKNLSTSDKANFPIFVPLSTD